MAQKIVVWFGILMILTQVNGLPLMRNESHTKSEENILTLQDRQIYFLEKLREETKCDVNKNQCLNGGQCFESQCYCPTPYIGPYCQFYLQIDTYLEEYQVVLICLLCIIIGWIIIGIYHKYRMKKNEEFNIKNGEYSHFEIWEREKGQQNN